MNNDEKNLEQDLPVEVIVEMEETSVTYEYLEEELANFGNPPEKGVNRPSPDVGIILPNSVTTLGWLFFMGLSLMATAQTML